MNFKIIAFIIFCSLPAKLIFSQTDSAHIKDKIIISITAGAAIPIKNFSIYDRAEPNIIGGAEIGFNGRIEGRLLFSKHFGFKMLFDAAFCNGKEVPKGSLFSDQIGSHAGSETTTYSYNAKQWNIYDFLGGLTAEFGNEKTTFNLSLLGGYQRIRSPETQINRIFHYWGGSASGDANAYYFQSNMVSNNLAFDSQIGVRINLNSKSGIVINMDYLISQAAFNGELSYAKDAIYTDHQVYYQSHTEENKLVNFDKMIYLLFINAGFSYSIK